MEILQEFDEGTQQLSIFIAIACCTSIAMLLISGIGEAQVESATQKLVCEINLMKNKLFTD
jgi:hypothetical protein